MERLGATLLLTILACSSPTASDEPQLDLHVDADTYIYGGSLTLTATNEGRVPAGQSGTLSCMLKLDRHSDEVWEQLDWSGGACILPGGLEPMLDPGESEQRIFEVGEELFPTPGIYRFRTSSATFDPPGSVDVISNSFEVAPSS